MLNSPAVHIQKPKLWFAADHHHGHERAITHNRRPFRNLQDQDLTLIEAHNRYVKPGDRTFIIGDFSFYDAEKTSEILALMNGTKNLIKGNHDHSKVNKAVKGWDRVLQYHEERMDYKGFDHRVCLFHFPILVWHQSHDYATHIHGHCHGNLRVPKELAQARMFDAGIDNIAKLFGEYRPVELNEVMDLLAHRRSFSLDHHSVRPHPYF